MAILKKILAILAGLVAGGLVVAVIEMWLSPMLFDLPDSMVDNNPEQVATLLKQMPMGALLLIVASQFAGALVGTRVTLWLSRLATVAWVTGGIFCALTVMNLATIHHPLWMTVSMPFAALLGVFVVSRGK